MDDFLHLGAGQIAKEQDPSHIARNAVLIEGAILTRHVAGDEEQIVVIRVHLALERIQDIDEKVVLKGRDSDAKEGQNTDVARGAFRKRLRRNVGDVIHLFHHPTDFVLGLLGDRLIVIDDFGDGRWRDATLQSDIINRDHVRKPP